MSTETRPDAAGATAPLTRSDLPVPLLRTGKVRDVYDLGDALLLLASDRVSAFDVVMPQPVPRKGEVLTLVSAWWFRRTADLVPNHLITVDPAEIAERYPRLRESRTVWARRSMLVRKLEPFPIECVVRGYVAGSAWKEYARSGTLAGEPLPPGLVESERLPELVFSPATKAEAGHDENITYEVAARTVGPEVARRLRDVSLALYRRGQEFAERCGILVADTKFEFGRDEAGEIVLIDELLTPDSSRFWPTESYVAGRAQPSLDKQPLRDYLESLVEAGRWDRQPPGPDLPQRVVEETAQRYQDVFHRLTGTTLDEFPLDGEPRP